MSTYYYTNELYHHGIKGQKWGLRRYQNADGSYTEEGKERYGRGGGDGSSSTDISKKKGMSDKTKKALKIGAAVVGTALAVYGAYKIDKFLTDKSDTILNGISHAYRANSDHAADSLNWSINSHQNDWTIANAKRAYALESQQYKDFYNKIKNMNKFQRRKEAGRILNHDANIRIKNKLDPNMSDKEVLNEKIKAAKKSYSEYKKMDDNRKVYEKNMMEQFGTPYKYNHLNNKEYDNYTRSRYERDRVRNILKIF